MLLKFVNSEIKEQWRGIVGLINVRAEELIGQSSSSVVDGSMD